MKPKTGEIAQTTLSCQSQYHRGSQKKSLVMLREMDQRERENDAFLKWGRKMIKNSALRNCMNPTGAYVRYNYHLFLKEVVIQLVISCRQIDKTTIDPQELLKNLKGWTVKKYKRTETNGRYRVDKTYRHPKSKKWLRSLCKVREFIMDSSHTGKASDNGEGGSQVFKLTSRLGNYICLQLRLHCQEVFSIHASWCHKSKYFVCSK
ncbi:hypothetical protein Hdeb2414_s0014g00429391 [Helianthus debilis subsp. tardiflorus]